MKGPGVLCGYEVSAKKCECTGTVIYNRLTESLDPNVLKRMPHAQKDGVDGAIDCNNETFGDPDDGNNKQCVCFSDGKQSTEVSKK